MTKAKDKCTYLSTGNITKLQNNADELEPLLQKDIGEVWIAKDIDMPKRERMGILRFAVRYNAIQTVGTKLVDREGTNHKDRRNKYTWNKEARDRLQAYIDSRNELPCPENHRAHIYNDPETPDDMLGCSYCAEEGNHPELSKETVKECL